MIQVFAVMSSHAGILHCSSGLGKVPNTDNSASSIILIYQEVEIHGSMYALEVL